MHSRLSGRHTGTIFEPPSIGGRLIREDRRAKRTFDQAQSFTPSKVHIDDEYRLSTFFARIVVESY